MLRMLGFSLYLLLHGYTGAGRSVGPPTCVGGREGGGGGGGGVRPFLFSTENSHIVAYSLPIQMLRVPWYEPMGIQLLMLFNYARVAYAM